MTQRYNYVQIEQAWHFAFRRFWVFTLLKKKELNHTIPIKAVILYFHYCAYSKSVCDLKYVPLSVCTAEGALTGIPKCHLL